MEALSSIQPEPDLLEKLIRQKEKKIYLQTTKVQFDVVPVFCRYVETHKTRLLQKEFSLIKQKKFSCLVLEGNIFILFTDQRHALGSGAKNKVYLCYDYLNEKERAYHLNYRYFSKAENLRLHDLDDQSVNEDGSSSGSTSSQSRENSLSDSTNSNYSQSEDISDNPFGTHIEKFKKVVACIGQQSKVLKLVFYRIIQKQLEITTETNSSTGLEPSKEVIQHIQFAAYKYYKLENLENLLTKQKLLFHQKMKIAFDIISNMYYFHKYDLIHNDIAEKNVLVTYKIKGSKKNLEAVLGDLDLITEIKNNALYSYGGTPLYYSPQKIHSMDGKFHGTITGFEGKQADVYAMGLVLYHLFYDEVCPVINLLINFGGNKVTRHATSTAKMMTQLLREKAPKNPLAIEELIWQMINPDSLTRITSKGAFEKISILFKKIHIPLIAIPNNHYPSYESMESADTASTATNSPISNRDTPKSDTKRSRPFRSNSFNAPTPRTPTANHR